MNIKKKVQLGNIVLEYDVHVADSMVIEHPAYLYVEDRGYQGGMHEAKVAKTLNDFTDDSIIISMI